MAKTRSKHVGTPSAAYNEMAERWALISALNGGTLAMRAAAQQWLPAETKETTESYNARLERSVLFNGYRDTARKISARPFAKPIALTGDEKLPEQLAVIKDDVDGEGTNLTELGRELFRDGLNHGLVHLVVDYPTMSGRETKAEEQASGARPLFIPVSAANVIGWISVAENGTRRLTQVRIAETAEVEHGTYGTRTSERVRVWTETAWELWEKRTKKITDWVLIAEGEHSFGAVPMFTAYFERDGFMIGTPPLEDLAWLNLAHWQSSSDQRNILRFARTGLWFVKGMSKKDFKAAGGIKLGPNQYFLAPNPEADMKVVEHSGSSIKAGTDDLRALEEKMELMGLQPFVRLQGYQTATGTAINEGRNQTEVQAWVRAVERLLAAGYNAAARWIKQETATDKLVINIFSDFGVGPRITADVDALIKARVAGEIDHETFLREFKKRGVISEDSDIATIIANLEAEGPALSSMGGGGGFGGADGE